MLKDKIGIITGILVIVLASWLLSGRMQTLRPFKESIEAPGGAPARVHLNSRALFPVQHKGLWGYMDAAGKIVVQPQYTMAFEFHEGLAHVLINGLWGYIDESGAMAIQPQYARADRFYEGFARVSYDPENREFPGFIDRTGKLAIEVMDAEYLGYFSAGLASARVNGKFGYIDKKGEFVIPPAYDVTDGFTEGLAKVAMQSSDGFLWGFIDMKGNLAIPMQYDDAGKFSEGLASVRTGDLFGFIDKTGNFVIPPQFEYAGDMEHGLAPVSKVKFGYCDRNGALVIPPRFDLAGPFTGDYAAVAIESGNGPLWGFIDRSGEVVIQPQFDGIGTYAGAPGFANGLAQVEMGESIGYIDTTGHYVWQPCFSCNLPGQ